MNLYLDDDSVAGLLVRLLRQSGHDVTVPADVALAGAMDASHLAWAIKDSGFCCHATIAISVHFMIW